MTISTRRVYEFDGFRLEPAERLLTRAGKPVALTPKIFDTLQLLVENSGCLVTKNEFMERVWRDAFVEEATLAQNISQLRKAIGDAEAIETVPKKGYRFTLKVQRAELPSVASTREPVRSIAVLPFQPLAQNDRDESLEMGMADTLITRLSGIRKLVVRPMSSVRKYADSKIDALAAGRELGVETVLEGSLQRQANKVRVTARLMRVPDGASLWAGIFEQEMTDIFALQDVISSQLTQALSLELSDVEQMHLVKHYTQSTSAYQLYLKGRYFWWKNTPAEYSKSQAYFHRAVEEDPSYALGYCGLNSFYGYGAAWGMMPPEEGWPKAEWAVKKALEIDDQLAEAHLGMAALKMVYSLDWPGTERESKRAIELSPGFDEIHYAYSFFLVVLGRYDEAVEEAQRALECNPFSVRISQHLGYVYYCARQFDFAIRRYIKAIDLDANDASVHQALGDAYEQQGDYRRAVEAWTKAMLLNHEMELIDLLSKSSSRETVERGLRSVAEKRLKRLQRDRENGAYVPEIKFAREHLRACNRENAMRSLIVAVEERNVFALMIATDPFYDPLRSDRRFAELVKRLKLNSDSRRKNPRGQTVKSSHRSHP